MTSKEQGVSEPASILNAVREAGKHLTVAQRIELGRGLVHMGRGLHRAAERKLTKVPTTTGFQEDGMKKVRKKSSPSDLSWFLDGATGYGQLSDKLKESAGALTARQRRTLASIFEQWVIQLRYTAGELDGHCLEPDLHSFPFESKCKDPSAWWKLVASWSSLAPERRLYLANIFEAWVGMIRCWVALAPRRQTPPHLFVVMDRLSEARLN
jgi:hypothetical protein